MGEFPKNFFRSWAFFGFAVTLALSPTARAAVDPAKLFYAQEIDGVGGYYDYTQSTFSVLCNIVAARLLSGSVDRILLLANGNMPQGSYSTLPPPSYLSSPPGDIDDQATYDVSPNVWAGSNKGGSVDFSFSAFGIANKRGYPPTHTIYVGSDLAILKKTTGLEYELKFITPSGAPAWVYNAKSFQWGQLYVGPADSTKSGNLVVFSDQGIANTTLGDSAIVNLTYSNPLLMTFTSSVVSKRGDPHAQPSPRGGSVVNMDGDVCPDILVMNSSNSPYLYWFKGDCTGSVVDASYQPVTVGDADISHPNVVWAGLFTPDVLTDILVGRAGGANRLTLLEGTDNTGNNFTVKHISPAAWPVSALAVGDVDGDGRQDVVAGMQPNTDVTPSPVTIFFSDPGFNSWTTILLPRGGDFTGSLLDLQLGDLDHDGKLDVVALFSGSGPDDTSYRLRGLSSNVHVWLNRNTGSSRDQWFDFGVAEPALPLSVSGSQGGNLIVADFDGDHDADILRVAEKCPAVIFENVFNTQRRFRVRAATGRGVNRQTTTTFFGVDPDMGFSGKVVGETVGSR